MIHAAPECLGNLPAFLNRRHRPASGMDFGRAETN
jgi:hypothetical protein